MKVIVESGKLRVTGSLETNRTDRTNGTYRTRCDCISNLSGIVFWILDSDFLILSPDF